ncbi:MAG: hypothetical protein CMF22_04695 [Idiomarinaceae bacterium]|nr:hypothetical protein [Idiomarinaceae bacterium]|tara:strand:+ start:105 stop:851 length:747 start_codon:yes stop_codon:yes gene_type:complete
MKHKTQYFLKDMLMPKLEQIMHGSIFPEEYDYIYDSISDAKDRRRGINPMSEEYTSKVNERRRKLGISPLGENGQATDGSSHKYAKKAAQKQFPKVSDSLAFYLSETLYHLDPANTCCNENKCFDEYDRIARSVIYSEHDGTPFSEALPEIMIASFGRDAFDHKTINTLSEIVAKDIAASIAGGGAIQRILKEMDYMLRAKYQTINGIRGANIYYDKLHQRLDRLAFDGPRPTRTFNPELSKKGVSGK